MITKKLFTKQICSIFLIASILYIGSYIFAQSSQLGSIEMQFCNDNNITNEIDTITKAGEKKPLCIQFTNISNKKLTLNVEFVDAVITDDSSKNRACNAPDRPKKQFANFIQDYPHTIILESGATTKNEYIVQYPIGFEGLSHGCIIYNVIGDEQKENNFFTVMVRSAKFIDIFVNTTDPIIATSISSSPTIIKRGNKYALTLGIDNKGNVPEEIEIHGTITNIFGFQKEFSFQDIIDTNTGKIFKSDPFILPFYKGPFLITTKISYNPQLNFNLTDGKQPSSQNITGGTMNKYTITIIRDIRFALFIGGLLTLLRIIFKKR